MRRTCCGRCSPGPVSRRSYRTSRWDRSARICSWGPAGSGSRSGPPSSTTPARFSTPPIVADRTRAHRRCVALLRAINVGGRVVKMQRLREALAPLPLQNVATFIASGNVLFDSDAAADVLEEMIETRLRKELGYEVLTFVRTLTELGKV